MGNNKRKKKQNNSDFKKVKFKVGQKRPKGANETQISFKSQGIVVPSKDIVKEGSLTNVKKQSLKDLLVHLNHYSASVRQDSLVGLRALFKQHETELHENLSLVLNSILSKMTDTDSDVRHSLLLLLQYALPEISSDQVTPFLALMVAHLSSAMTHIYSDIQLKSLEFLSLMLELFPKQMKKHSMKIIDNLVDLISRDKCRNSNNSSVNVSKVAEGRLASSMSKLKILNQILACLKIICDIDDAHPSSADLNDNSDKPPMYFEEGKTNYIPLLASGAQENLLRFSFESQFDLNQTQQQSTGIKEFIQRMVPLLIEFWVECSPSQLTSSLPNSGVSSSSVSEMTTIMSILKILLNSLYKEDTSGEMRNWFAACYFKDFKTHFMKFFPFQATLLTKTKGKSRVSDTTNSDSILMLNVSVCEVMSVFMPHAPRSEPWIEILQEFIVQILESSVSKIKVHHLNSILLYVQNVLQGKISEGDSTTNLLESLHKVYLSSHMLSSVKIELLKFFATLYFKSNVSSGSEVSAQWKSILNQWVKSLPKLLVKSNASNLEITKVVIKLLPKLINQSTDNTDTQEIQTMLSSFLMSGALCTLPIQSQKSLAELIFSLPILNDGLLKTLVLCCNQSDVSVDVVQYLLHVLHYRSSTSVGFKGKPSAVSLSSYLSFLFSIALGISDKELSDIQSNSKEQSTYIYSLIDDDCEPELTSQHWQRHLKILEAVCAMYRQLPCPKKLLKQMEPVLERLLESKKTLPVRIADSILKLYRCYLDLADTSIDSSHSSCSSTPVIENITRLSLSCLLLSMKENSFCDISIREHLYNDVTEVLEACPLVMDHLMDVLSANIEDLNDNVLHVIARLLQSFCCKSKKSNLFIGCTPQLSKVMERCSILHSQSPHMSNLRYQFSLFMIEVNRRNGEQCNQLDTVEISS